MPDEPLLTMDAVRDWVGDFEIGKGRPYAETAVCGCQWEADRGDLIAFVRGTRSLPYRVSVHVGSRWNGTAKGTVQSAICRCPVGESGKCKHVAAVLIAYVEDPARFLETMHPEDTLDSRDKTELLVLVDRLLHFAPTLKPLLAAPMPGFVRETPSPDVFRVLAREVIQGARLHEDRVEEEIVEGLWPLIWLGEGYRTAHDEVAADALAEGVARAIRASGLDVPRFCDFIRRQPFWDGVLGKLEPGGAASGEPPPF